MLFFASFLFNVIIFSFFTYIQNYCTFYCFILIYIKCIKRNLFRKIPVDEQSSRSDKATWINQRVALLQDYYAFSNPIGNTALFVNSFCYMYLNISEKCLQLNTNMFVLDETAGYEDKEVNVYIWKTNI